MEVKLACERGLNGRTKVGVKYVRYLLIVVIFVQLYGIHLNPLGILLKMFSLVIAPLLFDDVNRYANIPNMYL